MDQAQQLIYQRDGDDGSWSSFALSVGTPAQSIRVLVSTNSPETMVVQPLGCTKQAIDPLPSDCANSRGGLFNHNKSSTWINQGRFGINENGVGFEANLGYSVNADYGLETLGLGFAGGPSQPVLKNQTVAAFAQGSPFYTYKLLKIQFVYIVTNISQRNIRFGNAACQLHYYRQLLCPFIFHFIEVAKPDPKLELELYGWS